MKCTELNNRWKAYPFFKFVVIPTNQNINFRNQENVYKFETIRQWCLETWGDTPMLDIWYLGHSLQGEFTKLLNKYWSYDINNRNGIAVMRLYLRSEKELALFNLKWK